MRTVNNPLAKPISNSQETDPRLYDYFLTFACLSFMPINMARFMMSYGPLISKAHVAPLLKTKFCKEYDDKHHTKMRFQAQDITPLHPFYDTLNPLKLLKDKKPHSTKHYSIPEAHMVLNLSCNMLNVSKGF